MRVYKLQWQELQQVRSLGRARAMLEVLVILLNILGNICCFSSLSIFVMGIDFYIYLFVFVCVYVCMWACVHVSWC